MTTGSDADRMPLLVAVTADAREALGGIASLRITHFPFKIGRESRSPKAQRTGIAAAFERRKSVVAPELNDLYLIEPIMSIVLQISREHCAIESVNGQYFVVDRGSACGTVVAGTAVGGDRAGGRAGLRDGDLIVIGTAESPYVFKFRSPPKSTDD